MGPTAEQDEEENTSLKDIGDILSQIVLELENLSDIMIKGFGLKEVIKEEKKD